MSDLIDLSIIDELSKVLLREIYSYVSKCQVFVLGGASSSIKFDPLICKFESTGSILESLKSFYQDSRDIYYCMRSSIPPYFYSEACLTDGSVRNYRDRSDIKAIKGFGIKINENIYIVGDGLIKHFFGKTSNLISMYSICAYHDSSETTIACYDNKLFVASSDDKTGRSKVTYLPLNKDGSLHEPSLSITFKATWNMKRFTSPQVKNPRIFFACNCLYIFGDDSKNLILYEYKGNNIWEVQTKLPYRTEYGVAVVK